mmetsp:Transcript_25736/g.43687  ORF Transcript_25736/g.43687 Transcript_25736/m.43687 type:complete len:94 (-) Transcript_25736:1458-1739(-)
MTPKVTNTATDKELGATPQFSLVGKAALIAPAGTLASASARKDQARSKTLGSRFSSSPPFLLLASLPPPRHPPPPKRPRTQNPSSTHSLSASL